MQVLKKILLLFVSLSSYALCFAQTQTIDSLKKILPLLKGTARIDCLNELGSEFSDRYCSKSKYQQTDTAYMYTLQAQNESQQLHYLKGIGRAMQNMGYIEEERGDFKAGEDHTRKALHLLEKENMQAQYHRAQIFLGWCLYNRGFFKQSITVYQKEMPYYEAIKDSERVAMICRMTAGSYGIQGNSENAFNYFQKDFSIQKKPTDAWGKRSSANLKAAVYLAAGDTANAILYRKLAAVASRNQHVPLGAYHSNMAAAYKLQKKYDSALWEIRENIAQIQSSKTDSLYRNVALMENYSALIDLFLSLKKYDSVIIYCPKPLSFFKKGDNVTALMPTLRTVAAVYNVKHQNDDALHYTNQLLSYAQRSGARPFEREAYKLLWQIYIAQGKTKLADNYHLKYILLNDSLQNDKYISQSAAWKAINDINLNEANYKNKLRINEERNYNKISSINNEMKTQLYIFTATIILISLFTVLIIRNSRLKRKKDQLQLMMTEANISLEKQKREQEITQLQQQKTELELQALRAQMNPHFIFNCLNSINRFIINNDAAKAADYLTKFAKLIRIVLEQSGKSFISLEDEICWLKLYMDLEALRFEKPFQYNIDLNGTDVSSVMIPTMLIQPFIENAIWHGLHPKQNGVGEIKINMHQHDSVLQCSICDNGVGVKDLNQTIQTDKKSLGISITQQRLQLANNNDEKIKIEMHALKNESGEKAGTCVNINIPVTYS